MALESRTTRRIIEVVLGIVIIVLAYFLYRTIREPAERMERQEQLTEQTRERMLDIRQAMIRYEEQRGDYPDTLDSLVMFIEQDSALQANADSIFGPDFNPDSLPYSPRTGEKFILEVNDTSRVSTYKLTDPDRQQDYIGTTTGDVTQANAASWE